MSSHAWFAARFMSGYEVDAARKIDLGAEGNRGFCPVERRRWVHRGVKHERAFPVIAGYIFVEMRHGDAYRWHDTADCRGFLGFIGGAQPQPALDGAIEQLFIRATEDWLLELTPNPEQRVHVRRGDRVIVTDGLLSNLEGHVEWTRMDRDHGPMAACLLRGLFAGEVRAELPVSLLERLDRRDALKKPPTLMDLPVIRQPAPGVIKPFTRPRN